MADRAVDPDLVLYGDWSEHWGREALHRLCALAQPPDAIVAGNDQIGRGLLEAMRERGLVAPDDIAVIGFDNWSVMAEAARPPLSSIDMNLRALGEEAGRRLRRMMAGEEIASTARLPCSLVVRASTDPTA